MATKVTKQTETIVQFLKDNKESVTCSEAASNFKVSKAVINNLVSRFDLRGFLVPESGRGKIGGRCSFTRREDMKNRNILVIGDLHEPFCLDDYLSFCQGVYKQYKCNHVIFIGDVIDNHYSSFHDADPDGLGALAELEAAISRLSRWYKAFPTADVCVGNHDRIVARKGFAAGLSNRWLKGLSEVLDVPKWNFQDSFVYDGVEYIHGEGGPARLRCMKEGRSIVQGHRHTEGYVHIHPQRGGHVFGVQVGCGLNNKSYAAQYAKNYPSPVIGCAVVLNNGTQPVLIIKK